MRLCGPIDWQDLGQEKTSNDKQRQATTSNDKQRQATTRKDKTRTRKRCSGPVLTDICTTHDGASEFQVPDQKFPYNLTGAILKKVSCFFFFFFFLFSVEALRSRSSVDERRTCVNGRQTCEKFGRCRRPQGPLWPHASCSGRAHEASVYW